MSGWLLLGLGVLFSVIDFLFGVYLTRMTTDQLQRSADGSVRSLEQVHRLGRIVMMASPLVFLLLAALAFGLFGPDLGVETISLNQG